MFLQPNRVELSYVETTMATISDVIDEFNLPLRIVTAVVW